MPLPDVLSAIINLEKVVKKIGDSQLVGKYYTPTVTIDENNIPGISTVDPLPNKWTVDPSNPNRYTNGGYAIETDLSNSQTDRDLEAAFDGSSTTFFESYLVTPYIDNPIFTVTLPTEVKVNKIKYYVHSENIESVVISGSNNKTSWTTLNTNSKVSTSGIVEVTLSNTAKFKYYRMKINRTNDSILRLYELQISSYEVPNYTASLYIEGIPGTLQVNQRLMIKVPNYDITGVSSVNLNSLEVDTALLPNRYYELVYDGTKYLAKEVI